MCARTGTPPTHVCDLGLVGPGTEFHDPNGERWMVCARPAVLAPEDVLVVNLGNGPWNVYGNALKRDELKGTLTPMRANTKLGYDAKGRLYASTSLNGWNDPADPAMVVADSTPPDDATKVVGP